MWFAAEDENADCNNPASRTLLSPYRWRMRVHQELDAQYGSLDDAIADAIAWVEPITENNHPAALIGVEVSTTKGNWRTCRMPAPLLCPLPPAQIASNR